MKIIFYEHFIKLCELNGILPTIALKKMGLSAGCLKKWKSGANVTVKSLEMVANFFNVSLEYFSSDVEEVSSNVEAVPHTISKVKFGERIRAIRKSTGCNQKDFGALLDIPQSTLSAYEIDRMQPTITFLINIATKFNVSLDWLCGIENNGSPFEKDKTVLERAILDEMDAVQGLVDHCNDTLRSLEHQLSDLGSKNKQFE